MKINLGCGDHYAQGGWVNVDHGSPHYADQRVNLITDTLPWLSRSVSHIYCGHVLEHLPLDACHRLLKNLLQCMEQDGMILVVGPDIDIAKQMIKDETFDFTYHSLESLRFGADRWEGDQHQWDCTGKAVMDLLRDAGWPIVVDIGIENADPIWPIVDRESLWQCAILGVAW